MDYSSVAVLFLVISYAFETYIDSRQYWKLLDKKCPKVILEYIKLTSDQFEKSRIYSLDKLKFSMFNNLYSTLRAIAFLHFGIFPILWNISENLVSSSGFLPFGEISSSCVFIILFQVITILLSLPTSIYGTFVLEERHGFNKQTPMLFVTDMLKGFVLFLILGVPLSAIFVIVVRWAGPSHFFVYTYTLFAVVTVIAIVLFPLVIQPLFNKFSPLSDGELKDKLMALCKTVKFPVKKLFVVDGSTRSSHSNAYVFGFFKLERIVLYDTLVSNLDTNQIISVVGHELGHWKLMHLYQSLAVSQLHTVLLILVSERFLFSEDLYKSFGFATSPVLIGIILFQFIYLPVEQILTFFMNVDSRRKEFEADKFAAQLGYAENLIASLKKMALENKSNLNPDPWYSAYHYSHPPFYERLMALNKAK